MKKGWVLLYSTFSFVICVYAYRLYASHTPVVNYRYAFDSSLSDYAHNKIIACLAQVTPLKPIGNLQRFLQTTVPVIATVHKQRLDNHTYVMTFEAEKPCARTTNRMVITRNGRCITEKIYTHEACRELPCITLLTSDPTALKVCARWIAHVPRSFFDTYTIHWKNHTSLMLQDKAHPDVWIQCSTATLPATTDREDCITCARESALRLKKSAICVCDIRFEKQIIVRPMMLGGA